MSPLGVVVSGAAGRLGQRIVAAVLRAPDLRLRAALVRPGSSAEGAAVDGSDLRASSDAEGAIGNGAVLVEAAPRAAALEHAEIAALAGSPLLVATTGLDSGEQARLVRMAERIPILIAPNLSFGITVVLEMVRWASQALAAYDLEVMEIHHNKKRDAPSGTAWALARAAEEGRGRDVERDAVLARGGETGPRGVFEVGVQAIRGGDAIGEHTVFFFGAGERVEVTHRATSREVFAEGAVRAARFLGAEGRAPGLYAMRDLLKGAAPGGAAL